jgi:hypothetical protein
METKAASPETKTSLTGTAIRSLLPAVMIALLALCPVPLRANTIALSFSGATGDTRGSDIITVGWAFSLSSPVLLTDLGIFDSNLGAGLGSSHEVTVWTSTGVVEAQANVPAGTTAPLTDGFRYVSLTTPILLAAGDYTIAALYSDASDAALYHASVISTASGVTYVDSRSTFGNVFPATDAFGNIKGYFGPNFQFTNPPANGVPEAGSALALMLLALTLILGPALMFRNAA